MDKNIKNIKYYVELINQIKLDIDSLQEQKSKYETILLNEKSLLAKRNGFFSFNGKLKAFIKEIEDTIDSLVKNIDEKNKEIVCYRDEMITLEIKKIDQDLIDNNINKNISIKRDFEKFLSIIQDYKYTLNKTIKTFKSGISNSNTNQLIDAHNIFYFFVENGIEQANVEFLKNKIFAYKELEEFSNHIKTLYSKLEEILDNFEYRKKIIIKNNKNPSNYQLVKHLYVYYIEFNEILTLIETIIIDVINIKNNEIDNLKKNKDLLIKKNENEFIFSLRENYNLNIF